MSPRTRIICALLLAMAGAWYLSMAWDALSRVQEHPFRVVGIKFNDEPDAPTVAAVDTPPPPAPRARRPASKRKETP